MRAHRTAVRLAQVIGPVNAELTPVQNGRVSPRTSSQHSVKSAQSDKASKASASPLSDAVNIGDQPSIASIANTPAALQHNNSSGGNLSGSMSLGTPSTAAEKRDRAQEASLESHAAKVARMEAPPNAGLGMGGGIPEKIEEEPTY